MAKQETNFIEILLKETVIGMTIYDDNDIPFIIDEINYDPLTSQIYISDTSGNTYNMSIRKNFDFEFDNKVFPKIKPNKPLIIGKRKRKIL